MVSVAGRTKEKELAVFILRTQKAQYVSYYLLLYSEKTEKWPLDTFSKGPTGADLRGTFGGGDEQVLHVQRLDK